MAKIVNLTQSVEKIYSSNFLFRKCLLSYYKPIVKRETKLIDKSKVENILCIGGGNFPATAILLHKLTKANVTVIDNDQTTIKNATKLIKKLKLENKVNVLNVDGLEIDALPYDLVHVALQISPKDDVIKQIRNSKKDCTPVIVRIPKDKLKNLYNEYSAVEAKFTKQPFYSNIGKSYLYE